MQIDIENAFNSIFWTTIFKELCDVEGPLMSIICLTRYFMVHIFLFITTWVTCGGGHHYWIIFKHEARWPLKRSIIWFDPLLNFFRNHHMGPPTCVFPSLTNDTHIVGPMNELSCTFDHLSTQLAQVELKVKMLICKCCSPSRIFLGIEILHECILVTNGPHILGVLVVFKNFAMHFLDEVLF